MALPLASREPARQITCLRAGFITGELKGRLTQGKGPCVLDCLVLT